MRDKSGLQSELSMAFPEFAKFMQNTKWFIRKGAFCWLAFFVILYIIQNNSLSEIKEEVANEKDC